MAVVSTTPLAVGSKAIVRATTGCSASTTAPSAVTVATPMRAVLSTSATLTATATPTPVPSRSASSECLCPVPGPLISTRPVSTVAGAWAWASVSNSLTTLSPVVRSTFTRV